MAANTGFARFARMDEHRSTTMHAEHLEQALRHVRDGEIQVRRQRNIVGRLREGGHSSERAEEILDVMEWSLELHRDSLRRIIAER